jgi:hypothetical protein
MASSVAEAKEEAITTKRKTRVVNVKRTSEWTVYIGRSNRQNPKAPFGNPFILKSEKQRKEVIADFSAYFYKRLDTDPDFLQQVLLLKGKVLGCYCHPKACHGDVIADYLNSLD